MRSSKSRSRSKSNRNRSVGNIVNRVFDSSGPDGKVRGTPQQVIDKYLQLARDSQLSNDRVATENFLQHAEHYTRLLSEAQREAQKEAEARREQQEAQARERQQQQRERGEARAADAEAQPHGQQPQPHSQPQPVPSEQPVVVEAQPGLGLVEDTVAAQPDNGLVETPEDAPAKPRRRSRRKPKPEEGSAPDGGDAPQAAE